jgi:ribosome recycling factor
MIDEVLSLASNKMDKTIEAVKKELATIRTGRANPALIENIKVDYYGTPGIMARCPASIRLSSNQILASTL